MSTPYQEAQSIGHRFHSLWGDIGVSDYCQGKVMVKVLVTKPLFSNGIILFHLVKMGE